MKKPNVGKFIRNAKKGIAHHSPEILTGLGIAGMLSTTVLAVKATPKALRLIEQKKYEEATDELKPVEVVKAAWKPYIPAMITGTFSIACLIGANSVNAKRNAALATAYKISETALTEYREKVIETIGEKKEQAIRENIDKDRIETNVRGDSQVIVTGLGTTLCYDHHSGRTFYSDIELIRKAENNINYRLLNEEYVSLNDLYDELGLEPTETGNLLGWNIGRDGQVSIEFSAHLTKDGKPCLALDYHIAPRYDYSRLI